MTTQQPDDAPVVLSRSAIHTRTWVTQHGGDEDLNSFLCAGPLRGVKAHAVERWGVTRWTREGDDSWLGWTR